MEEIALSDQLSFPPMRPMENQEGFQCAFLIRMLFSCLVDADLLDTEAFYLFLNSGGNSVIMSKSPNRDRDLLK